MMAPISFWVSGKPIAQPRAKAAKRGAFTGVYDPGTANGWKDAVAVAAKPQCPPGPLSMPLRVDIQFYFPRPKAHYRVSRSTGTPCLKDNAPKVHAQKPDRDNLEKAVTDALKDMRFMLDDSQICDGRVRKLWDDGRGPGCLITISEVLP